MQLHKYLLSRILFDSNQWVFLNIKIFSRDQKENLDYQEIHRWIKIKSDVNILLFVNLILG